MFESCRSYDELAREIKERIRLMNAEARRCKERLGLIEPDPVSPKSVNLWCGYSNEPVPDNVLFEHVKLLRSYRHK